MYYAARTIKVKTESGTDVRNRGDQVPEADNLDARTLGRLIRRGHLVTDGDLPDTQRDTERANEAWRGDIF